MTHASGNQKHVPVRLRVDTNHFSEGDKKALLDLMRAVQLIDPVWTEQMAHQDFAAELETVAVQLEAAAPFVTHSGFRNFLLGRAEAFRTNSYHASDIEWVQYRGAPFELIIGPFEPSDKLGGAKEFEGTLGIVLPDYQKRVRQYEKFAIEFEVELGRRYDFDPRYTSTPITAVDVIVLAGGAMSFIAMASKLPNDEDIRARVGSKTTLFRNIIEAKFRKITFPIAQRVLGVELNPETFVQYVLGHELSHGFAFRFQRERFGPLAASLEEAKADVFGVLFLYFLAERGIISRETAEEAAMACIADSMREVRVNLEEAHAVGALMRFNWLREAGALRFEGNRIALERSLLRGAFETLGDRLYALTQTPSPEAAAKFVGQRATVSDPLRFIVGFLEELPVDIVPKFEV